MKANSDPKFGVLEVISFIIAVSVLIILFGLVKMG